MMKYSSTIDRLTSGNSDGWSVFRRAKRMEGRGVDIVELAIGEPDVKTPDYLVDSMIDSLRAGRTNYADSAGETVLREALAARYTKTAGYKINVDQILTFPGTQTALFAVIHAIAGPGDEVLIGDPMYATYASIFASSGAKIAPVPLGADRSFAISADDIEARITERTTAIFINTPHNPTGSVLDADEIEKICQLAECYDLWLLSDEVYDEMIYGDGKFYSPLSLEQYSERVIVVNSISKSHAAPGFRSGWCVASTDFCGKLLPYSEAMLFGNQPFIADATAKAVASASEVARGMAERFSIRAEKLEERIHTHTQMKVQKPAAGMFALLDVSSTGMTGEEYANDLLDNAHVAVMPGSSFGMSLKDWVRISLTKPDPIFDEGCERIIAHAQRLP